MENTQKLRTNINKYIKYIYSRYQITIYSYINIKNKLKNKI